jgi:hypothetical protein
VSLLIWAGADPRSIGPAWGDEEGLDESEYSSALIHAAYSKDVEILKRLKPDAEKDKLDHLLTSAAAFGRVDVVRYLLDLGAKPNDKANGGSSSLDRCLSTSLGFRGFRYDSYFGTPAKASKYSVSDTLDTLRLLLEHGAQWRPDEPREIQWVRRNLLECEPDVTVELIEQLMKHTACTRDTIHEVLQTPAMKKHLTPVARKFGLTGVRYTDKRAENGRRAPSRRKSPLDYSRLASRYDREKIMRRFGHDTSPIIGPFRRLRIRLLDRFGFVANRPQTRWAFAGPTSCVVDIRYSPGASFPLSAAPHRAK